MIAEWNSVADEIRRLQLRVVEPCLRSARLPFLAGMYAADSALARLGLFR